MAWQSLNLKTETFLRPITTRPSETFVRSYASPMCPTNDGLLEEARLFLNTDRQNSETPWHTGRLQGMGDGRLTIFAGCAVLFLVLFEEVMVKQDEVYNSANDDKWYGGNWEGVILPAARFRAGFVAKVLGERRTCGCSEPRRIAPVSNS